MENFLINFALTHIYQYISKGYITFDIDLLLSLSYCLVLDNNWSMLIDYLQGEAVSIKGDRGEKVRSWIYQPNSSS